MTTHNYVLAFDIERSGPTKDYDTIGIGATVLCFDFSDKSSLSLKEVDRLFLPGCFAETKFEQKCWDEFWGKDEQKVQLADLRYEGSLSPLERQKEMINAFQDFRTKWELKAEAEQANYYLVTDNAIYDGGFLNDFLMTHTKLEPMPMTASTQRYGSLYDIDQMLNGFLMAVDPKWTPRSYGMTSRIRKLYDIKAPNIPHDHNPANDAHNIAYDFCALMGIKAGVWECVKGDTKRKSFE